MHLSYLGKYYTKHIQVFQIKAVDLNNVYISHPETTFVMKVVFS
jgi:hypothetical protein